jgi:suppressor of ftsI
MKVVVFIVSAFWIAMPLWAQQQVVADPPEVRSALTLAAVYDSAASHNSFAYAGSTVPPVIRVSPGGDIRVHYVNNLPGHSDEECATSRCSNMTNLHFHGLHVSPKNSQDDVLTMMAMPGEALERRSCIPW